MAKLRATPSAAVRLPGVGERLDVEDSSGRPLQVVRHRSGRVEVHAEGRPLLELETREASAAGAFMTGHFLLDPTVALRLGDVLGGLVFDWVRLEQGDRGVGKTIAELEIRRRTGVSIVAILRGSLPIVAPDPDIRLEAGDDLVIACRDSDRDGFVRFMGTGR